MIALQFTTIIYLDKQKGRDSFVRTQSKVEGKDFIWYT